MFSISNLRDEFHDVFLVTILSIPFTAVSSATCTKSSQQTSTLESNCEQHGTPRFDLPNLCSPVSRNEKDPGAPRHSLNCGVMCMLHKHLSLSRRREMPTGYVPTSAPATKVCPWPWAQSQRRSCDLLPLQPNKSHLRVTFGGSTLSQCPNLSRPAVLPMVLDVKSVHDCLVSQEQPSP